jgi:diacylglycerol kinase
MDAKWFLRISWVAQLSLLILVSIVLIFIFAERMPAWLTVLPILLGAIGVEAAAAAGGSNLKRITEARLEKAKKAKAGGAK